MHVVLVGNTIGQHGHPLSLKSCVHVSLTFGCSAAFALHVCTCVYLCIGMCEYVYINTVASRSLRKLNNYLAKNEIFNNSRARTEFEVIN
jgi:hypothetical protein